MASGGAGIAQGSGRVGWAGFSVSRRIVFVEARLCPWSTRAVGSVDSVPRALSVRQKLFESQACPVKPGLTAGFENEQSSLWGGGVAREGGVVRAVGSLQRGMCSRTEGLAVA